MTQLVVRHKCHNSPSYGSSAYLLFSISSTTADITADITTDITTDITLTQPYLLSRPLRFWIIGNDGILHSENLEREGISHGHGNSIIHEQAYN